MELFSTEIEKSLDGLGFFLWGWGVVRWIRGEVETGNSVLEMLTFSYLLDTHVVTLGRKLDIQVWIWKRCLGYRYKMVLARDGT